MIIDANRMFKAKEPVPYINEPYVSSSLPYLTRPSNYRDVLFYVKRCPEAIGLVNGMITDVMAGGVYFEGGGKRDKIRALEYWNKNLTQVQFNSIFVDYFTLGDGYGWIGKVDEELSKRIVNRLDKSFNLPRELLIKAVRAVDEEGPADFRHVAASTMYIDADMNGVKGYRQVVGGLSKNFDKDSVVHLKFMDFDGKVYGYGPFESALPELQTIAFIKDYAANYFKNGGVPDHIFSFPKLPDSSFTVAKFEQVLKTYRSVANQHKPLVTTGEVVVQKLGEFNKDMPFRELYLTLVGSMFSGFNAAVSDVMPVLGGNIKVGATGSDSDTDRRMRVTEKHQDYFERVFNSQFFEPVFSTSLRFRRVNMGKEIKEAQMMSQKAAVVTSLLNMNAPVEPEYYYDYLKIPEKYRVEGGDFQKRMVEMKKQAMTEKASLGKGTIMKDSEVERGPAVQAEAERKRKVARNMGEN